MSSAAPQASGIAATLVGAGHQPAAPAMPAGASTYFAAGDDWRSRCVAPGAAPVFSTVPTVLGQAPAFHDPSGRPLFQARTEAEALALLGAQALRRTLEAPGVARAEHEAASAAAEAARAAHVAEATKLVEIQARQIQFAQQQMLVPDARLPIAPLPADAAAAGAADPLSLTAAYLGQLACARTADGRDLFKTKPGPGF